jgi:hypothetical protein
VITFRRFLNEVALTQPSQAQTQQPQPNAAATPRASGGGTLQGSQTGGQGGNWGGALPKLISILPPGNWYAGSQKRGKVNTKSGGVSDHYSGNSTAYACDFGLNSTFKGNKSAATKFCIDVANNAGQNITSWSPYVGSHLSFNTSDGYRVQIIWLSNVGGNHYDHVHLGVKAGRGAQNINMPPSTDDTGSPDTQGSGEAVGGGEASDYGSIQDIQNALQGAVDVFTNYGLKS